MPIYDYRCMQCETVFEASHTMSEPAPNCPNCGGQAQKTILAAPAIHGQMAQGRELAMRSLLPPSMEATSNGHGPGCSCCTPRPANKADTQNAPL
jgi:putative FmdB family regulatory protein